MENGFKIQLEKAKKEGKKAKLTFKYPQYNSVTYRRGQVIHTYDNCFLFDDIELGEDTYSYVYLIEVKILEEKI